ncbi:diacylglycerol kinase [Rhizobium rhizosphaerae]|uniref:Dihydrofolate reductase n=1 Tax=Xaviernesmea rhizosphaerae TaxID=1672749 RepID=A0A1Q9AME5_9HYPH|nr:dihydrofolate reductase [Xaviernesmea rhizosphaerae]OLP56561.1 diacylglycerol kinase [Xaviernesmea rhizosphaerae]
MSEAKGKPQVSIVVAMAKNRVIGRDGGMPWRLPTDLAQFKRLTLGKPVIMGRRTFESLGRPLPGRDNIVISGKADLVLEGAEVVASLEAALALAERRAEARGAEEIAIIGGGQIYAQALDHAEVLYVTEVEAEPEGDTLFPEISPDRFQKIDEAPMPRGEKDSHAMRFVIWRRQSTGC